MRLGRALVVFAVAAVALVGAPKAAEARKQTYEDPVRGFEFRLEDSFERVPPKPGEDDLHIAAEFKDPSPKYKRFSGDSPTFKVIWTVTPKGDAPAEDKPLPKWAESLPPEQQEMIRSMQKGTKETLSSEVNRMLKWYERLFGPYKSLEDRLAEQDPKRIDTVETRDDLEVRILEVNYHRKRPKDPEPNWWMWIGMTEWETADEKIELGFYGYVDVKFAKDFRKQFEYAVKSFQLREVEEVDESDDRLADAIRDTDPPEVREKLLEFVRTKLPETWEYERTDHYLVIFDEDVDSKRIVDRVTKEIEALREQVYEVLFPPDQPVTAVSIVRVCKTRQQYMDYGAPGGSAGYWSPYHEELVLYQDRNDKKDAIRVLYHEAFHQYIYYSVGEISPHSWFNEGHGDFFSGHEYSRGKFHRKPFDWRTGTAKEAKRRWEDGILHSPKLEAQLRRGRRPRGGDDDESSEGSETTDESPDDNRRLTLREWLTWRQPQYYGSNAFNWGERDGKPQPIPGGVNYALGWSFIYFLRTTDDERYQQILPRYFNALKSFVTQAREAQEAGLEEGFGIGGGDDPEKKPDDGEKPEDGDNPDGAPGDGDGDGEGPAAGGEEPKKGSTTDRVSRSEWHGASLDEAMQGIDLDELEKDWLDHDW